MFVSHRSIFLDQPWRVKKLKDWNSWGSLKVLYGRGPVKGNDVVFGLREHSELVNEGEPTGGMRLSCALDRCY